MFLHLHELTFPGRVLQINYVFAELEAYAKLVDPVTGAQVCSSSSSVSQS